MMHKLISIDNSNSTSHNGKQNVEHFCMSPKHRQELGCATLSLIVYALHASKLNIDNTRVHIKQIYQSWEHTLELTVSNAQIQKALKMAVHLWIDLKTNLQASQPCRTKQAESLLRHLNNCMCVFNLGRNRHAIKILHYLLLHPVTNLPNHLMQQQADLHAVISGYYNQLEGQPNYESISHRLFVHKAAKSARRSYYTPLLLGISIGMTGMYMLQSFILNICIL